MSADASRAILKDENKLNKVVKAAFDQVDTDGSGKIDKNELDSVMNLVCKDMGAEPPSNQEIMEVFDLLDTNKTGKIEFNEFKNLIKEVLSSMC